MGVGLVRSLQPPDILWIHWRVHNSIANTSKWVLFLPSSDVYVRSFLYLLYTLIKFCCTKALSDPASSLAPDWILLLRRPRTPVSLRDSETTFQDKDVVYISKRILLSHKNSKILSFLTTGMDFEGIMPRGISQRKTNTIWFYSYGESIKTKQMNKQTKTKT